MNFFDLFNTKEKPKEDYQIYTYRTKDGEAYYQFSYHKISEGYEVDIHSQPSYQGRKESLSVSHRLSSFRDTKHKICVENGFEPQTLEYAKHLSTEWAEYTHCYIKTGSSINRQIEVRFGTY